LKRPFDVRFGSKADIAYANLTTSKLPVWPATIHSRSSAVTWPCRMHATRTGSGFSPAVARFRPRWGLQATHHLADHRCHRRLACDDAISHGPHRAGALAVPSQAASRV